MPGSPPRQADVTDLLQRWQDGDAQSTRRPDSARLRRTASDRAPSHRRRKRRATRCRPPRSCTRRSSSSSTSVAWRGRTARSSSSSAATLMRRILVDYARTAGGRIKRGAGVAQRVADDASPASQGRPARSRRHPDARQCTDRTACARSASEPDRGAAILCRTDAGGGGRSDVVVNRHSRTGMVARAGLALSAHVREKALNMASEAARPSLGPDQRRSSRRRLRSTPMHLATGWLAQACGNDIALRHEVDALIDAHFPGKGHVS